MTAKKSVKKSTAKVVVKSAELVVTDKEISYDEIWQFVQAHAGGPSGSPRLDAPWR